MWIYFGHFSSKFGDPVIRQTQNSDFIKIYFNDLDKTLIKVVPLKTEKKPIFNKLSKNTGFLS